MATEMKTASNPTSERSTGSKDEIGAFFGELFAFNNSLKLFHWHVTGKGSYAQHIALDQAIDTLIDTLDRFVETTYAMKGDRHIVIPETKAPLDIVRHAEDFYEYLDGQRKLLPEDFSQSIYDDYQETIQQLLFRLKRLQ